ncbi:MAG: hypothetical protein HY657_17010 [Acidobacteria bacterium]|nr:hypothetical protein [Acidobacteriota bacterium]
MYNGRPDESLAAVSRIVASNFSDPEGLFYLARHLAHLGEKAAALQVFRRVVDGGYCCYPAMVQDAWLEPLRGTAEFASLLERVRARHNEAAAAFVRLQGEPLLGLVRRPQPAPPTPLHRRPSQGRARRGG